MKPKEKPNKLKDEQLKKVSGGANTTTPNTKGTNGFSMEGGGTISRNHIVDILP